MAFWRVVAGIGRTYVGHGTSEEDSKLAEAVCLAAHFLSIKGYMKNLKFLFASALLLLLVQGCATKTYGRQGTLTGYEKDSMTCREIDLEVAKTRGFVDHVNKESEFSGRDVLAILSDFGIGNNMEKSAAIESGNARIEQLRDLRDKKVCTANSA